MSRRTARCVGALAFVVATVTGALVMAAHRATAADTPITVAAKNFAGASVLSQAYGQALAAHGAHVKFQDDVGPTETVFAALRNGDIDGYAEYQGTLLTFLGGTPTHDPATTHSALEAKLRGTGIVASTPAPAVDVNGFYVTRKTANRYKLTKVSDLARVAGRLVFGGPPECAERPLCLGAAEQRRYGLRFKEVRALDAGGSATRTALERGDIDVALLFTGSSLIPKDAVLLRDDKGLQPADNPVFLLRESVATPDTLQVVDAVSEKITTATYNKMSLDVSARHQDAADVAARFLADNRLG